MSSLRKAWHKLIRARDLVVGNLTEGSSEPVLRIDLIQLGHLDEGDGNRQGFAAAL